MGINDEIRYNWTFGWDPDGLTTPRPIVNSLLKALIERDYTAMDSLYASGARLGRCNDDTLTCVLYHVVGDSRTVRWLISHGLHSSKKMRHDSNGYCCSSTGGCHTTDGYQWGLIPRAWACGSYESMEMLAEAGFTNLDYCVRGEPYKLLYQICIRGDVRAMRLLREYGLDLRPWDPNYNQYGRLRERFANSPVIDYVETNPIVIRKGFGLDGWLFSILEKPELRKPRFFHRNEDERWNQLEQANYNDRVRAQKEFAAKWSPTGHVYTKAEQEAEDRDGEMLMKAMREAADRWKQSQ